MLKSRKRYVQKSVYSEKTEKCVKCVVLNYFFNWGVYIEKYKKPSDD